MTVLEDKAKELGRLIGQSAEYKAVKRSNDALSQDKDAVVLLRQMEQIRIDAQKMMERGEQPTEEMENNLDALLGQVQGKMVYQNVVVSQENFEKVMARVNEWILDGIKKGATSSIITLA
jgi:cell fate (sporulation/competence/biofilm development) regulator YlbF (YheA/YmcA/DUF963 family)